jgi:hypothetical protein
MSTPTNPAEETDLRGIKLAFLEALEQGEAPASWIRQYPQYARALTDLALAATAPADPPEATITRAATFLRATLPTTPLAQAVTFGERVKQAGLSMRDVATRVRLNTEILFKLDRRIIPVETVPTRLLDQLATMLGCSPEALRAGLAGNGPQTAGAMYHAKQPPAVGQQPFAEAVRASLTIAPADRAYWLDEG